MKIKKWEIALIAALIITIFFSLGLTKQHRELSDKLIRLHVVANSDSDEDQAVKLKVRDEVLQYLAVELDGVKSRDEAAAIIESCMDSIIELSRQMLRESGFDYPVTAEISLEQFPTREYDAFSLPAGLYTSLRIIIGEGSGQNWWCVVFPPICAEAAVDIDDAMSVLSDDEVSLITEDGAGYVVKFKAVELLGKLRGWLGI